MEHLFVPYELALKLKEKGFDDECLKYWSNQRKYGIQLMNNVYNQIIKNPLEGDEIPAPLYQQVIDWFREERSIDIFTNAHYKTDNSVAGYLFDIYYRKQKFDTWKGGCESPNFYEGLNKAIEEALKLI